LPGLQLIRASSEEDLDVSAPERMRAIFGAPGIRSPRFVEHIPFALNDTTAGSETELQAAVIGDRDKADLPLTIEQSNYFANIVKRVARGDTSSKAVTDLERFLKDNTEGIWENSWVRFRKDTLSPFALRILDSDLQSGAQQASAHKRPDAHRFIFEERNQEIVRVPISYLVKLALADAVGVQDRLPDIIRRTALDLMNHFLNDNSSPETLSFHIVPLRPDQHFGLAAAKETAKRLLLTQFLVMYANEKFGLTESGQKALIYLSPHPPVRQKQLNECISDAFYRELFMSPCLSGWKDGHAKYEYMCLCHEVLSRSQLNAVAKLREAGVINRDLVVLPSTSNVSLANNGVHISIGSLKLTQALKDPRSGVTEAEEKHVSDLVVKIVEHFLPLFVGTYSAAPYRLGFSDFHPEKVLGFLPHELDYTHLRMIWRRWKNKANIRILGQPLTPFGPKLLDSLLSFVFRLKGDFLADYRLTDYLVSVLSTYRSPALNGTPGNGARLKKDLCDLGIFHTNMPLYLLYRQREFATAGFSGFEGRQYSLFESFSEDMAHSANLQTLVTALAFKYILQGKFTHKHIPDDPFVESERRQIVFGSAIGLPTFFVRDDTTNMFMRMILDRTRDVRYSRRYPGYIRVYNRRYCKALIDLIISDASDIVEMLNLHSTIDDLRKRLNHPEEFSVSARLTKGILDQAGAKAPMKTPPDEFNLAAEKYYRTALNAKHIGEAFDFFEKDLERIVSTISAFNAEYRAALSYTAGSRGPNGLLRSARVDVLHGIVSPEILRKIINLLILVIRNDSDSAQRILEKSSHGLLNQASIY
jgi:hypothetical protein